MIDLYCYDFKLAIETHENGHSDRNIKYEIKRQKAVEKELSCKFIRIGTNKEDFDIFRAINEIFGHIKQLTLINNISMRLLRLEFKSDNIVKPKATKFIVKKILSDYQ